jgi:uncharacterized delta-60 repeat protein
VKGAIVMSLRPKLAALLMPFLLVGVQPVPAAAWTPPGFDPSFGHHGVVLADLGGSDPERGYNSGEAVAVRARIVVAASGLTPKGRRVLVLSRYLKDGTLDRTFGKQGRVRADVHGFNIPNDVALTEGGGVLVLLWTGTNHDTRGSVLLRFTERGRPDRSFGIDGRVAQPAGVTGNRITVQPDGRILVIASGITIFRYLPDGRPDPSFGTDGVVKTDLGTPNDRAISISVLPSRRLLLVATTALLTDIDSGTFRLALVRYRYDGRRQMGFGRHGVVRHPIPDWSGVPDAVVDRDGRISVLVSISSGSHGCGVAAGEVVRRYRPVGSLDRTFGGDGSVAIRDFEVRRLAAERDGSLFVVGQGCTDEDRLTWAFAVARLRVNGSLLRSFGQDGVSESAVAGRRGRPAGITLQRGGRLLVAGVAGQDLALVRYLAS